MAPSLPRKTFFLDLLFLKVFGTKAKTAKVDESTVEVIAAEREENIWSQHSKNFQEMVLKIMLQCLPSMRNPYDHDKDSFDVFQTDSSGFGKLDAATRNSDFPAKQSFVIGCGIREKDLNISLYEKGS